MSREKQIDIIRDLLVEFDEMGFVQSIPVPDHEAYAIKWRAEITKALEEYFKESVGEWEKRTFIIFDSEKVGYRCSECNTTWDANTNYCPNCGAKMKGDSK